MPAPTKTLLINWDGADWTFLRPFLEKGILPALTYLIRQGASGELEGLSPYVSPLPAISLVTGKRPWKHGIHGATQVDAQGLVRPVSSRDRQVPALWNIASRNGLKTHAINWPVSPPAEEINGICVSEAWFAAPLSPPPSGSIFPETLSAELAGFRLKPAELDLKILRLFIPEVTQTLFENDPRVRRLVSALTQLYAVHNLTASLLETEPWQFVAVALPFLDQVLADFAPFLPPAHPSFPSAAVRRYAGVVEAACRLLDTMLAEWMTLAGRDARIILVSAHGLQLGMEDSRFPQPLAVQPGRPGILVATGPGFRPVEDMRGATLLDLAPTLLHSLGLPVGADMDGRVLDEIFTAGPIGIETIPTWDEPPLPPGDSVEPKDFSLEAESVRLVQSWNRGLDLLQAGHPVAALPDLEEAHWAQPESAHAVFWLARAQAACGLWDEAAATAERLDDFQASLHDFHRHRGILFLESARFEQALASFRRAQEEAPEPYDLPTLQAAALSRSGRWLEALELLQPEVVRRPVPETWLAIIDCYLQLKRPAGAIAAARQLLLLQPGKAFFHLALARALLTGGETEEAWNALSTAHRLRPNMPGLRSLAEASFPERKADWESWKSLSAAPPALTALREETRTRHRQWQERQATRRLQLSPVEEMGPEGSRRPPGDGRRVSPFYRPPWPDEIERLMILLGDENVSSPRRKPRVWEAGSSSRFAGVALWAPPPDGHPEQPVEIAFQLRPGFLEPRRAEDFLRELFSEILEAGHTQVRLRRNERQPWEQILARFGLRWIRMEECWTADSLACHERLEAMAAKGIASLPEGWVLREIEERDIAFVLETSGASDFMTPDHLRRVLKNRCPELSCLVDTPSGPAAVLLATRFEMTAVLEYGGTAAEFRKHSALISYWTARHFHRRNHPAVFDRCLSLTNPAKSPASRALNRRFGGKVTQTFHHFEGEIRIG